MADKTISNSSKNVQKHNAKDSTHHHNKHNDVSDSNESSASIVSKEGQVGNDIKDKIDEIVDVLNKKADAWELSKKADVADVEKLLSLFLSGDHVVLGGKPLKYVW